MSNVVAYQISAQSEQYEEKASGAASADAPADINIRKGKESSLSGLNPGFVQLHRLGLVL